MSNNYQIIAPLALKMELSSGINAQLLPLLHQAVNEIAQATAQQWIEAAHRAKLWSGERDAYAKSISYRMTGDFSAVVESSYKGAAEIETGRPPRDLKKMLNTSLKVRVTTKGTRYLVIPFRHNTPGSSAHAQPMPKAVFKQAKLLTASRVTSQGQRQSGTGAWNLKTKSPATVATRKTNWGDRLLGANVPKNQQGMVRMDTSTGKQKSSTYLTFRIMSEKSSGWIIPAQPGQFIAKGVADDMRPKAEAALTEAVKRSLG